ncbi:unnamed protein product, partial [Urochloa humidicola]
PSLFPFLPFGAYLRAAARPLLLSAPPISLSLLTAPSGIQCEALLPGPDQVLRGHRQPPSLLGSSKGTAGLPQEGAALLPARPKKSNRPVMSETAAPIGLSWAPKLPSLATTSGGSKNEPAPMPSTAQRSLWKPPSELVDGLFVPPRDPRKVNKLTRKSVKDTSGKGWFDMPAPSITPELKKDLEILQLRHVMDPKRHFKRSGKSKALPKYFQVGTVVEPASEFYSGRLTKRERKTTLVDELLSDQSLKSYRIRKVREIQERRTPGGNQKWKNKGKQTLKRAKDRRK